MLYRLIWYRPGTQRTIHTRPDEHPWRGRNNLSRKALANSTMNMVFTGAPAGADHRWPVALASLAANAVVSKDDRVARAMDTRWGAARSSILNLPLI